MNEIVSDREKLAKALGQILWGYAMLHLDINLGSIDILPNWLGFYFFYKALSAIAETEPSAGLLKPLCIILGGWEGLLWVGKILGIVSAGIILTTISTVLRLYFFFQLLTNIADAAEKFGCPGKKKLLTLRTVQTITLTAFSVPINWEKIQAAAIMIGITNLIILIWLCAVIASARKFLKEPVPEATEPE